MITQQVTSGNSMAKCLKALEAHKDREGHRVTFSEVTLITQIAIKSMGVRQ